MNEVTWDQLIWIGFIEKTYINSDGDESDYLHFESLPTFIYWFGKFRFDYEERPDIVTLQDVIDFIKNNNYCMP